MQVKKQTEKPVDISLKANADIFISVIIGNRQIGGAILRYKDEEEPFAKGKIKSLSLGKGKSLIGRTLLVMTNVLDSNDSTDKIVITHEFDDAVAEFSSTEIDGTVDNDGDVFSSSATYNFIK